MTNKPSARGELTIKASGHQNDQSYNKPKLPQHSSVVWRPHVGSSYTFSIIIRDQMHLSQSMSISCMHTCADLKG